MTTTCLWSLKMEQHQKRGKQLDRSFFSEILQISSQPREISASAAMYDGSASLSLNAGGGVLEHPFGDGVPVGFGGEEDGLVVEQALEDDQLASIAGGAGDLLRHCQREQVVFIAVHYEDGQCQFGHSLRGAPEVGYGSVSQWGKPMDTAASRRLKSLRREQGLLPEDVRRRGRDAGSSEKPSRKMDGQPRRTRLFTGCDCVFFAVRGAGDAGAFAVAGVVEDQRTEMPIDCSRRCTCP